MGYSAWPLDGRFSGYCSGQTGGGCRYVISCSWFRAVILLVHYGSVLVALVIVTFSSIVYIAIIIILLSFLTVITSVMISKVLACWMAITHVSASSYICDSCGSVHSCSLCVVIQLVHSSLVLGDSVLLQSSLLSSSLLLLFFTIVVIVFLLCVVSIF